MKNLLGFVEQRKKMEAGCLSCHPTAWFTTAYLYISQLATISGGRSPIHHLGTWLVVCSKAPTMFLN